ncbi:MAG: ClcB-like voltage-gated chloride channel protein [Planctomycetota bacterium]
MDLPLIRRLLRLRLWLTERLSPGENVVTYCWAAAVGCLGGLSGPAFRGLCDRVQWVLTDSRLPIMEAAEAMAWWQRLLVPTVGGILAGLALHYGLKLVRDVPSADYMESVTIGDGEIRAKPTLVRILSSVFSIASGGSIGREGPMVQLAAMLSSLVGRKARLPRARLQLIVACGAASGIASAYNAPIGGALFVSEIVLGSIAMATLGPLVVASAIATVVSRTLMGGGPLFEVPAFHMVSPLELLAYLALGMLAGGAAPLFLSVLDWSAKLFRKWRAPAWAHLGVGGLMVGLISVNHPFVWGNGSGALEMILQVDWAWVAILGLLGWKLAATAATVGSGAVGGVFTPTLLIGGALGALFGTGAHYLFPTTTANPHAYALVGMGAFLAGTIHAPLTAILIVFDMTLSHEIILPLMIACVCAYTVAYAVRKESIYTFGRGGRGARVEELPAVRLERMVVGDLMKRDPICVSDAARFPEIVQAFVKNRHHNLFVVGKDREFRGVIPLHDIKPHLNDEALAKVAIAMDLLHDDFPVVHPETTLKQTLAKFSSHNGERIPVVERGKSPTLVGSISKTDLLLTMAQSGNEDQGGSG